MTNPQLQTLIEWLKEEEKKLWNEYKLNENEFDNGKWDFCSYAILKAEEIM